MREEEAIKLMSVGGVVGEDGLPCEPASTMDIFHECSLVTRPRIYGRVLLERRPVRVLQENLNLRKPEAVGIIEGADHPDRPHFGR